MKWQETFQFTKFGKQRMHYVALGVFDAEIVETKSGKVVFHLNPISGGNYLEEKWFDSLDLAKAYVEHRFARNS